MAYRIEITPSALGALEGIKDRRTRAAIMRRIDGLTEDPDKQGKALRAELTGYFSVRAAGQRYRVVYQVGALEGRVVVVLVGIRKEGGREDVYALAQRLLRRGLL
ncbi:MAG: type II toxin-antitoxin system RelE/ParE family toxin [Dehalococcoidia bacterium]